MLPVQVSLHCPEEYLWNLVFEDKQQASLLFVLKGDFAPPFPQGYSLQTQHCKIARVSKLSIMCSRYTQEGYSEPMVSASPNIDIIH